VQIERLLRSPVAFRQDDCASEQIVARYEESLLMKLKSHGAIVTDYPGVSHSSVVQRALARRRPFTKGGKGYRDTLIWESVLELAESEGHPVVFIASDEDFGTKQGQLHGDLQDDIEERGLDKDRIVFFWSLRDFVSERIKPSLKTLQEVEIQLQDGSYPELNLLAWARENIPGLVADRSWEPQDLGLPVELRDPRPFSEVEVDRVDVLNVRAVPPDEILIEAAAEVECEWMVDVFRADYFVYSDIVSVGDYDWDTGDWLGFVVRAPELRFELTFNQKTKRVTSAEATGVWRPGTDP